MIALLAIAGCSGSNTTSKNDSGNSAQKSLPAPWIDGSPTGSVSTILGEEFQLSSKNSDFHSIIKSICNHFEISCEVKPKWLLDRGITLKLQAKSVESIFEEMGPITGLKFEKAGPKKWVAVLPGNESSESEVVLMDDF